MWYSSQAMVTTGAGKPQRRPGKSAAFNAPVLVYRGVAWRFGGTEIDMFDRLHTVAAGQVTARRKIF